MLLSDEEMMDCLLPLIESSGDVISFKEQKIAIAKAQLQAVVDDLKNRMRGRPHLIPFLDPIIRDYEQELK